MSEHMKKYNKNLISGVLNDADFMIQFGDILQSGSLNGLTIGDCMDQGLFDESEE